MTIFASTSIPAAETAKISYSDVKDKNADLSLKIEDALGPNGLGVLSITEVPGFPSLRKQFLQLSPRLAHLSQKDKLELEDPSSRYNFGWSHGKETLESGKLDVMKGSFYANPVFDVPTTEASLIRKYPSYCGSNLWPRRSLPEFERVFKATGKLILDVGLLLAFHCDQYVYSRAKMHVYDGLEQILRRSRCHKGRMLYYFPLQSSPTDHDPVSSWCGWHTDHGSLTGLTRAMFMRNSLQVPSPDGTTGLYVRTRTGDVTEVVFGEDEIAYQIGRTTEMLSGGHLCATPHCVQAPSGVGSVGLERSTFALFMQPNWDENINLPHNAEALTFGQYSERLLANYYPSPSSP